jgi:hypothetical protein
VEELEKGNMEFLLVQLQVNMVKWLKDFRFFNKETEFTKGSLSGLIFLGLFN